MIKNFFWALINSGSGAFISIIPISIISRYIDPKSFIELSTIFIFSSLGNIIIDYGQTQRCYLRKITGERVLRIIESYMFFRALLFILIIANFALIKNYFSNYNFFIMLLIFSSSLVAFINFRPNYIFNKLKLFKLKTKYSFVSSLLASTIACITTIKFDPNLGYVLFIFLNPLFLGICMRYFLKLKLPKLKINVSISFNQLLKIEFIYQLLENIDDLIKRFLFQNLNNLDQSAIYLRNESFLYSPFKLINKSLERVILASWGPSTNIKKAKFLIFCIFIIIGSILIGLFCTIFGNFLSALFLGNQWAMQPFFFGIASFFISMKIIGINLGNLVKVKTKNFNFIFLTSSLACFFPLLITQLLIEPNISSIILIYCMSTLLKNIAIVNYLIKK